MRRRSIILHFVRYSVTLLFFIGLGRNESELTNWESHCFRVTNALFYQLLANLEPSPEKWYQRWMALRSSGLIYSWFTSKVLLYSACNLHKVCWNREDREQNLVNLFRNVNSALKQHLWKFAYNNNEAVQFTLDSRLPKTTQNREDGKELWKICS